VSKPDPPTPPNPIATAAAQTGTNVSTAVANSYLNNVNQVTPEGTLSYSDSGSHQWTDPSTGHTYTIPTRTATQTYSPQQQAIRDQTGQTQLGLATIGNQQTQRIGGMLNTPFNPGLNPQAYLQANPDVLAAAKTYGVDPIQFAQQHYQEFGQAEGRSGGAPTAGDPNAILNVGKAATSYDTGGDIQRGFGDAGDVTRSYGAGDFSQDRQNVEDSLMARMNPQLQRERGNIEQRLADQGIRYGSQAYASAMDDYNRQSNDARFAAVGQAGSEQQRMMDMAAQRAGFQNSAQQQQYDQLMGRGSFANQAQAQQNAQNAALAGFGNAGLAQQLAQQQSGFNAQQTARNQYMQEAYQQRNQPLNEISALTSSSQMQQPNWLNTPTSQIANTDFAGIMNQNAQLQAQNYQTAQSGWNATMGGILGAAGSAAGGYLRSDRDVKENIDRMGTIFAATPEGERRELPIHSYSYKDDPDSTMHVGPMAQDVEKVDRAAVKKIGGVRHIDTRKVMGSILRAA
jgi:hypothetical protein